ncbi:MAG: radical SAM protein [Candidatus Omnitrophota bacterium]
MCLKALFSHLKLVVFYRGVISIHRLFKELLIIAVRGFAHFPATINILITQKCNFSCHMCFWSNSDNIDSTEKKELNTSQIEKIVHQIKEYKPLIHIGGGEPFMHQDLSEIVAVIKQNKLKCIITTNGFLMDRKYTDKLIKMNLDILIISLYGIESVHDQITGVKHSFKETMKNMKYFLKMRHSTKIFVSIVPLPENIKTIKQLVGDLSSIGVDAVKIEQLNFLTDQEYNNLANNNGSFNFLPTAFIKEGYFSQSFAENLAYLYSELSQIYSNFVFIKPYLSRSQLIDWYTTIPRWSKCFFLTHSLFVNYNGDIVPCQSFSRCVLGNIERNSLKDIWTSEKYKKFRKAVAVSKPISCVRCCKN